MVDLSTAAKAKDETGVGETFHPGAIPNGPIDIPGEVLSALVQVIVVGVEDEDGIGITAVVPTAVEKTSEHPQPRRRATMIPNELRVDRELVDTAQVPILAEAVFHRVGEVEEKSKVV